MLSRHKYPLQAKLIEHLAHPVEKVILAGLFRANVDSAAPAEFVEVYANGNAPRIPTAVAWEAKTVSAEVGWVYTFCPGTRQPTVNRRRRQAAGANRPR